MIRLFLLACILSLSTTAAMALERLSVSSSSQQTAVVELFTSEGCSSCPPADRWFEAMVQLPSGEIDVLALAFHVDYWDYIGWKDRFGSPKYTKRQRQLGAINKQRTIYTQEFFVNGIEARGTSRVLDKVRSSNQKSSPIQLDLAVTKQSDSLQLELRTSKAVALAETLHYQFFIYENDLSSDVKRGENAGRKLSHQGVVRYMSRAKPLKEIAKHSIKLDADWQLDKIGVAALVTSPGNNTYIQAVHTPIKALLAP